MNIAVKYLALPNKLQFSKLWTNVHCSRAIKNIMLEDKIKYYEQTHQMLYNTPAQYKTKYPWLKEADSLALANAQLQLEAAFRNFFRDPKFGFPKFKSRHNAKWSYTTNCQKGNITIKNGFISLPKIGLVKIKQHRVMPDDYKIKSVTITITRTMKVYASVLFEYENQVSKVDPLTFIGLDYSSPYLYIDSDGNEPDYEKPFRKYQDKLAKEQKKLSKMQTEAKKAGRKLSECKNYQRQKVKVAKIYEKIANCRKDALHKLSHKLAEKYDVVGVEDLDMKALSQCLNLGKNTMDNSYGMFVRMLEYKLERKGKYLVKINKWYPSTKTCHRCGNTKPMRLNDREYVCPECGLVFDRDWNAAINIREEAKRLLSI